MATQKIYAGVALRETRARTGLTQRNFADRLGVSLPYLSQMENNHRPVSASVAGAVPSLPTSARIRSATSVAVSFLVWVEAVKTPTSCWAPTEERAP